MGIFDKILKAIGFEERSDNIDQDEIEKESEEKIEIPNAKFNLKEKKLEIQTYYPQSQEDVEEIVKYYLSGENIKIDLKNFNESDVNHISDFLYGVIFATNGEISKDNDEIYILRH